MVKKALLVLFAVILFLPAMQSVTAAGELQREALTPPPGSAERKLILDALRAEMEKLHHISTVFVVKYLKVQGGWAWIETLPRSADGANQYEDVSALLRKSGPKWKVAEIACTEEDNKECLGNPGYFKLLKKRFPGMPMSILPEQQHGAGSTK